MAISTKIPPIRSKLFLSVIIRTKESSSWNNFVIFPNQLWKFYLPTELMLRKFLYFLSQTCGSMGLKPKKVWIYLVHVLHAPNVVHANQSMMGHYSTDISTAGSWKSVTASTPYCFAYIGDFTHRMCLCASQWWATTQVSHHSLDHWYLQLIPPHSLQITR